MHRNNQYMEKLFTLMMAGVYGTIMVWMYLANAYGWTRGERTLISIVTPWR